MYVTLRQRSQNTLRHLCGAFDDFNLLCAAMATTAPDRQHYIHSSASVPSLRSREPVDAMDRPFTPTDSDAGHVKVVVRVRKFVRRGEICAERNGRGMGTGADVGGGDGRD